MNKRASIITKLISALIYCFGICSADAANIHVFSKDGVDKALLSAARSAADCWASYLQNEKTIYVQLDYGDIAASTPTFTDVVYVEYGNLIRPSALASQLRNFQFGSEASPDIVVRLNKNWAWDAMTVDARMYMLRAIAVGLGFGSSVTYFDRPTSLVFQEGSKRSDFDRLLVSEPDGKRLVDLKSGTVDLVAFSRMENIFAELSGKAYRMYTPKKFELGSSLVYLDCPGSLMHYDLETDAPDGDIDDTTLALLNAVGWNLPLSGNAAVIACNPPENGSYSIYTVNRFRLNTLLDGLSGYSWNFKLRRADGSESLVATGRTAEFSTTAISAPDILEDLYRDDEGYARGLIECDYERSGRKFKAVSLEVRLDLKPRILSVDNITRTPLYDDYFYDVSFTVKCAGAEICTVWVEQEYNPSYSPLDYFLIDNRLDLSETGLFALGYCWLHVKAINSYGVDEYVVEFEPDAKYKEARKKSHSADLPDVSIAVERNAENKLYRKIVVE